MFEMHAAYLIKVADKAWVDTMSLLALLDPQPDFLHVKSLPFDADAGAKACS